MTKTMINPMLVKPMTKKEMFLIDLTQIIGGMVATFGFLLILWFVVYPNIPHKPEVVFQTSNIIATQTGRDMEIQDHAGGKIYSYATKVTFWKKSDPATQQAKREALGVDTETISIDILEHGGIKIVDKTSNSTYTKTITKTTTT